MNYNEKMMMHNKVITTLRPDIKEERDTQVERQSTGIEWELQRDRGERDLCFRWC